MTIEKVVFFNSWHFGDLHSNKEYVRQFAEEFMSRGISVVYATMAAPRAANLPIECVPIYDFAHKSLPGNPPTWFDDGEKTMYINTWIGYYIAMQTHNFAAQRAMWEDISLKVFVASDAEIRVVIKDDPAFYVSQIDKDLIVAPEIPEGRNILICNDIPISGQSHNGDWALMITSLADEFSDINFLCTNAINTSLSNIYFTNTLTNRSQIGCDLPEIGYIAGLCDMIVTNSSGPGTFAMTKEVFFSEDKTVVAFVQNEGNTFWNGIDGIKADCSWYPVWDDAQVASILMKEIRDKFYD